MKYTENYKLPQWEKSDRIMMEDFNQMCEHLEGGLTKAQRTADMLPYVMGTYPGKENEQIAIDIGFLPSLVLIFTSQRVSDSTYLGRFAAFSPAVNSGKVTFTNTGFIVAARDSSHRYPEINRDNNTFQYVAFR